MYKNWYLEHVDSISANHKNVWDFVGLINRPVPVEMVTFKSVVLVWKESSVPEQ